MARNAFGRRPHMRRTYRSGLEDKIADQIKAAGLVVKYEQLKLPYVVPASNRKYTPDFLLPNGIVIESKGIFDSEDRKKMLLVREQHPDLDIRFVFSSPNGKLYKGSPTTYGMWCEKNGFMFAHKTIPEAWLAESPNHRTLAALEVLFNG